MNNEKLRTNKAYAFDARMPLYLALELTCVYLNICRVCKSFFLTYVFLLRLAKGGGGFIELSMAGIFSHGLEATFP